MALSVFFFIVSKGVAAMWETEATASVKYFAMVGVSALLDVTCTFYCMHTCTCTGICAFAHECTLLHDCIHAKILYEYYY